jgi:hypothetical protein
VLPCLLHRTWRSHLALAGCGGVVGPRPSTALDVDVHCTPMLTAWFGPPVSHPFQASQGHKTWTASDSVLICPPSRPLPALDDLADDERCSRCE